MTDFDAVYEDVMKYAKTSVDDIDTEEKLKITLFNLDRGNKITGIINRLVKTDSAKEDIENARSANEIKDRVWWQKETTNKEKKSIREQQKTAPRIVDTGETVKQKSTGARHEVYKNSKKEFVARGFFIKTKQGKQQERARLVIFDLDTKAFKLTGRWAKKD